MFSGGGIDLKTAAAYAEKNSATTSTATISIPTKVGSSLPFTSNPIKFQIPATSVSTASTSKPMLIKGLGNVNTADGKQIRFIPPKVNTANNRVPVGAGSAGGSGEMSIIAIIVGSCWC